MNKKFIWTNEYSVGIQMIDEQHRHFFDIANKIIDFTDTQFPQKENLLAMLKELGDYAFYHLGTEEDYFNKLDYQDATSHIAEHNKYRERIKNYFVRIKSEETDTKELVEEVAVYSSDWLAQHIMLIDKKYTKFFNEHGLV